MPKATSEKVRPLSITATPSAVAALDEIAKTLPRHESRSSICAHAIRFWVCEKYPKVAKRHGITLSNFG